MKVVAYDPVGFGRGVHEVAGHLATPLRILDFGFWILDWWFRLRVGVEWLQRGGFDALVAEIERGGAARLKLRQREVYRAGIDARWRARLEAHERER